MNAGKSEISTMSTLPQSFLKKKARILSQLSIPSSEYIDLSPKGSIDVGIRDLIDKINALEGCVTTSSCAGRVSVFLEGKKSGVVQGDSFDEDESEERDEDEPEVKAAGVGGKGGGGRWLFVSHDPVKIEEQGGSLAGRLGMQQEQSDSADSLMQGEVRGLRFIHFKFEPMILHILTASLQHAQRVLSAALQAGLRESGALNLISSTAEQATPMVGIRSMGLALESLVGYECEGKETCNVPEYQLKTLLEISNDRFVENTKRIERFRELLTKLGDEMGSGIKKKGQDREEWEDPEIRRERMRAEGMEKSLALKLSEDKEPETDPTAEAPDLDFFDQNT